MTRVEKARELFLGGCNCSQAVFAAFCDLTGLDEEVALRISSSFGGGMGHTGEACGAVTGMYMAAGMLLGYAYPKDHDEKTEYYKTVKKLSEAFKAEFGAVRCPELMGRLAKGEYPLPEGEEYKNRRCLVLVEKAVLMLENIL